MALITVENLTKSYGEGETETPVLNGVSFTIEAGEFVAIMGPSGSGKSTLLHILGFLDTPTGGVYRFEEKPMEDYSAREIAHVRNKKFGFVFQAFNLLARTTVLENVKLPLLYSAVPRREHEKLARRAIDAVGLTHRLSFQPSQLSGGEKQRVAIARALVNDAQVIFADEPTGNLDSKSGATVMEIIQQLNEREGRTIILITHETRTAERARRILRVMDGTIERDERIERRRTVSDFTK